MTESLLPPDVDGALTTTVRDILDGPLVEAAKGDSHERLYYSTGMNNPRARITTNPDRDLNLVGAVARFVWMMAASERLEDIAYYEPQRRPFSDHEVSSPGSSDGRRLFDAAPGLNQIDGVVKRLLANPDSRQAAAVVWAPIDAVRDSADIPCTFGLFFHIRDEHLVAATVMRSNNAYLLLPYNFFEFSMLAEVVATAVDRPLGPYVHWSASMHVMTNPFQLIPAQDIASSAPHTSIAMPPMPPEEPLAQINLLVHIEARLRHASNAAEFQAACEEAVDGLTPYWLALHHTLAAWGAAKRGWYDEANTICDQLPDYLQDGTRHQIRRIQQAEQETLEPNPVQPSTHHNGELLFVMEDVPVLSDTATSRRSSAAFLDANVGSDDPDDPMIRLEHAVIEYAKTDPSIGLPDLPRIRRRVRHDFQAAANHFPLRDGGARQDRDAADVSLVARAVKALREET